MKEKAKISCLSVSCPERFSLCCGAASTISTRGKFREGYFVCSNCGIEFRGGKCDVIERTEKSMTKNQKIERDLTFEFIKLNKRYPEKEEIQEMMIKETRKLCRDECEKDILTHRKMVIKDVLEWVRRNDHLNLIKTGNLIVFLEKYE